MATYSYTAPGSITKVTVGASGSLQAGRYDIVAYGGGGGTGVSGGNSGGKGAEAGGYFTLTAGEKLEIIAAGAGGGGLFSGGGGGGASQVFAYVDGRYVPLLVAGGGGGGGFLMNANGRDATVGAPYGSGSGGSYGGSATGGGGGGAGATSSGQSGVLVKGGADAASGGAGGFGSSPGGFGGGGAAHQSGGGGGGYTGGNGGTGYGGGYGGTSFVSTVYGMADAAHTKAGVVTGAGQVVFTPAAAICFASGSRIRVFRHGVACDVPVENLRVGDLAITASGCTRRIRWLGHRTLDLRCRPRPHEVQPIRIAAHAFGIELPGRDLFLSPGHPVLVDADQDGAGGYLVPIMCLINGTTVRRLAVDTVTYWHVELDAHDILLAEGLSAESYLDWGDRAFFTESSEHALQNPDFVVPGLAGRCRPVAVEGSVVEAERRRLDSVFSYRLHAACSWPSHAASSW